MELDTASDPQIPAAAWRIALGLSTSILRLLGPARYVLADIGGGVWWLWDRDRRRRTAANQRRAAPHITATEAVRRARASFREYARTAIDFVWAVGMSGDEVLHHSRVEGLEHTRGAREAGTGGILALSHSGSWDMAANIALAHGFSLTTVMAPIGPATMTTLVVWARQRNALEVFTSDRAIRGLLRAPRRGRFVAMLADVPDDGPTVEVNFCGGSVRFSSVPAWLAQRTGVPLFPVECRRGHGGYVVTVHPPVPIGMDDDVTAITARLARELEPGILATPGQWYPFGAVFTDAGAPAESQRTSTPR